MTYAYPAFPVSDADISRLLIKNVDAENIEKYLRLFTEEPHVAGTPENARVAQKILELWKANGLEGRH